MAQLGGTFDSTQVQPQEPFAVIPAGKYKIQAIASEIRPTKDGNGQYLWFEHEILDGEYQGRKLWERLNLWNSNQQAVEIAQRTLSAMCHATGQLHIEDSEALHFKPMIVTVRVKPAQGNYDASNEIRGYEPANGSAPVPSSAAPAQAPAPAVPAPSAAAMPWKRK